MNIGREIGTVFAVRLPVVALQVLVQDGDRPVERPAEVATAQPAEAAAAAATGQ